MQNEDIVECPTFSKVNVQQKRRKVVCFITAKVFLPSFLP